MRTRATLKCAYAQPIFRSVLCHSATLVAAIDSLHEQQMMVIRSPLSDFTGTAELTLPSKKSAS